MKPFKDSTTCAVARFFRSKKSILFLRLNACGTFCILNSVALNSPSKHEFCDQSHLVNTVSFEGCYRTEYLKERNAGYFTGVTFSWIHLILPSWTEGVFAASCCIPSPYSVHIEQCEIWIHHFAVSVLNYSWLDNEFAIRYWKHSNTAIHWIIFSADWSMCFNMGVFLAC